MPREAFDRNGQGYLQSRCKACRRIYERDRFRKRYRSDRAFRKAQLDKKRAAYWLDPEKGRARTRATYERNKLAGAAA